MAIPVLVLVGAALLIALLGLGLWHSRRQIQSLRRRIEATSCDLEALQTSFARFAPDEVVERILATGVSTSGERKEVTSLFVDLVGFTALSEQVEPSVLVRILNGYFERMSRAISEHRGHVSTFIGDGILALFGALAPNPWQANDAAHAALAMRVELEDYNRELLSEGLPTLSVGIGLQRGTGVAGLVGSTDLMEFAFVGRTVNVAARVQELTRVYPADIIVTLAVQDGLDPRFVLHPLPATEVKGVADPLEIYAVESFGS